MTNNYAGLLDTMMDAILAGDRAGAPGFLTGRQDFPAPAQLGVYIEAYRWRLVEALETAYPALLHYLGKPAFTALANGFIAANPSRYFNLDRYAIGFAQHVALASDDVFARELAQLEGAIHDVYQREETPAIAADWAQAQTPDTLAGAPLLPRAASSLHAFATPVDDYLMAFRAGDKPGRPADKKNWLIVLRHKNQVNRLPLAEGEFALLCLLAEGLTLAQALEDPRLAPCLEQAEFAASLQGWLSRWLAEGILRNPG